MADHINTDLAEAIVRAIAPHDYESLQRLNTVLRRSYAITVERATLAETILLMLEWDILESFPQTPGSAKEILDQPSEFWFTVTPRGRAWVEKYESNQVGGSTWADSWPEEEFPNGTTATALDQMPIPIENCRIWFKFLCPKTWNRLQLTEQADVRHCSTCQKNVHFCDTHQALEEHRQAGHCVCFGQLANEDSMLLGFPTEIE